MEKKIAKNETKYPVGKAKGSNRKYTELQAGREVEMENKDRQIVEDLKKRLPPEVKQRIRKLIVFGSRATGRATEESDLDIIALVDVKTPDIENVLDDAAYRVMWDRDFKPIISLKVIAESRFKGALDKGYSFYKHVEKEGVAV